VAAKHTRALFSARAFSAARANFSPTTEPIEPPMKENSKATETSGRSSRRPDIAISASFSPVFFCAAATRSLYFFWSLNFSASTASIFGHNSVVLPSSKKAARRARAEMAWWCPHFGHTISDFSSSGL